MAATAPESSEVPDERRVVLEEAPARERNRPEAFGIGTLFWRLADGLAVVDPRSSAILLWNPAAEALFGYTWAEVAGRPVALVLPAGLPPGAPSMAAFETTGRHRDGRALALELSLSPVERVAGAGTETCALAIIRDVADRKRIEASLVERTEKLQEAVDELRQADRYKDDFLAALSHELRTPIASIMGYTEFLVDEVGGPLTPDQAGFLAEVCEATQRLLARVDDVLDIARIEAGAFRLDQQAVDVAGLLRDVATTMGPRAKSAALDLRCEGPAEGLVGWIDGRQVRRVIVKLADNAMKFAPRGGRVTMKATRQAGWIRVEVVDSGEDVHIVDHPKLFDRFWQADMSSTRAQGGLGLGLPIARAIAEAHGGEIGARVEPGVGTIFWFTVPAAEDGHAGPA